MRSLARVVLILAIGILGVSAGAADKENHTDWIESQLEQIAQMGIQLYLAEQRG
ncbi:MAG: hypothetical protein AB7V19_07195 [Candidatus Bipolaricaulia bacterium]